MVKLTIPSEDILGDNYNITDISVSNYNPTIDGTVTLTVTVKDVYGDAVSGESVLVTASAGNFTKYNGSTITGASSYTGTTNSSGQFTLTYACSEWGLITFSANNRAIQVHVTGWREITAGTGKLWVNDETKTAAYYFTRTGAITTEITYANAIPSSYRPYNYVRMKAHTSNFQGFIIIEPNGTVRFSGGTSSTSITIACQITYGYGLQ